MDTIVTDLFEIIIKALPGRFEHFHSMADVKVKNVQAVEDAKVIKEIEERYSVYAEGVQLDVFNELQAIAEQINTVLPKLKQSVFNRRLDFRYLFKEDAEGKSDSALRFYRLFRFIKISFISFFFSRPHVHVGGFSF